MIYQSNHVKWSWASVNSTISNIFSALPARGGNKSSSSDGGNGRVLMVIVLDAFEPLQINNAEHCQKQADPKEQQTHIEPPPSRGEYDSTPHYI